MFLKISGGNPTKPRGECRIPPLPGCDEAFKFPARVVSDKVEQTDLYPCQDVMRSHSVVLVGAMVGGGVWTPPLPL